MRFLADMNLSPSWVGFLQGAGFEATHWSTVGAADASDRALMHWAATRDHVVLTNDLDFSAILAATGRRKPSVVQIRADLLTTAAIGSAVLRAIAQTQRELDEGALISVDSARARVRILPLGS
jgi:predicted nuclease of predicted toxin-antitoxin system